MIAKVVVALMVTVIAGALLSTGAAALQSPTPPGRPSQGYGSQRNYICSGFKRLTSGCNWNGSAVTCFIPDKLKDGNKAPVVIFLHGYLMMFPQAYLDAIKHLTNQGYIVIYPCINVLSPCRLLFDTDQNVMLARAIRNANRGLAMVGDKADLSDVIGFGHSLGGLLAMCWNGAGGIHLREVVSANLATDSTDSIPAWVRPFIKIKPVDWRAYGAKLDIPVMILTGDQDTISGIPDATDIYNSLTATDSRVLYCLQGDDHGCPALRADHNACMTYTWGLPSWLMNSLGGDGEVDATDYRFYWAALDAALAGKTTLSFDMGAWSDGVPVKPVLQLAP